MDLQGLGKWILFVGLGLAALGLILWVLGRSGLPLGNLPGDIRIEGKRGSFYFPIVTMLIVSLVLTLLINLLGRLFK